MLGRCSYFCSVKLTILLCCLFLFYLYWIRDVVNREMTTLSTSVALMKMAQTTETRIFWEIVWLTCPYLSTNFHFFPRILPEKQITKYSPYPIKWNYQMGWLILEFVKIFVWKLYHQNLLIFAKSVEQWCYN